MTMLSNDELEYMRSSIEELLPDTCNILNPTLSPDGSGGMTQSWGTIASNVPCRLDAKSGSEATAGQTSIPAFQYVLTIPYDQSIETTYRIEKGSSSFAVTSVDLDKSWAACKRVIVERL